MVFKNCVFVVCAGDKERLVKSIAGNPKNKALKRVVVSGASSGIGEAVALCLAAPGVTLGLFARRADKLERVAQQCRDKGAEVFTYAVDVTQMEACQKGASDFLERSKGIDAVFAVAGVGTWYLPEEYCASTLGKMFDVNMNGVVNFVVPFLSQLIEQKSGVVVGVTSLTSFRPYPGGAYSASKIAVRYFMDGLRLDLKAHGVRVTTVCPGFVASEMVDVSKGKYPFVISAEKAAKAVLHAVAAKKKFYVFPWQWRILRYFIPLIPESVVLKSVRSFPR